VSDLREGAHQDTSNALPMRGIAVHLNDVSIDAIAHHPENPRP
jgi:hypothetical protein